MGVNLLIDEISRNLAQDYNENSFYEYIKRAFDEYLVHLSKHKKEIETLLYNTKEFDGEKTYKRFASLIKKINACCLDILEKAYQGDILSAALELDKLLTVQKYTSYKLMDMYVNYLNFEQTSGGTFFRCVDFKDGDTPKSCGHVPYDKRYLVNKGRFNQLGFPCLYLSNSLECAQKEVGRKKSNKIRWYGKFVPKRDLLFMDFSIRMGGKIDSMSDYDKFSYLVTYPLRLLCLTKTKRESVAFTEEYIFSQLFLHILFINHKNGKIPNYHGIRFTSLKDSRYLNFVVPAKYNSKQPKTSGVSEYIAVLFDEIEVEKVQGK
ncbi:MAG: hypothetical protein J5663_10990 [Bacteroidaceae bacterium]|nr:hypothetical protein [Bacteroidaceae bacterium]